MNEEKKMCKGCIWADQCESDERCEDYTPIDVDEEDVEYYNQILKENTEEYEDLVKEQDDIEE